MNVTADELLKKHGLKNTRQRQAVLEEFSKSDSALSQPELEKRLKGEMDRVTLYRILSSFEDSGILHSVIDRQGTANYATCGSNCTSGHHHDQHLHFNCTKCKKVFCLETSIPKVKVSPGFKVERLSLIAVGLCDRCSAA